MDWQPSQKETGIISRRFLLQQPGVTQPFFQGPNMTEESSPRQFEPPEAKPKPTPQAQQPQSNTDSMALPTVYATSCPLTATPEELVLDFGLNTQRQPVPMNRSN